MTVTVEDLLRRDREIERLRRHLHWIGYDAPSGEYNETARAYARAALDMSVNITPGEKK